MRTQTILALSLAAVLGLRVPVRGQDSTTPDATRAEADAAQPAPGHSLHGEAFDDGPRQEAHLMPGMGTIHFPVSIATTEGQAFIDQGVAQLHSFYYLEAERSFRQAARIDPACALAYWGMAMANTNNAKRARGFLDVALEKARSRSVTRREQLYLDALAGHYKEGKGIDDKARRQAWLRGLEKVVQEFPADIDARAWLAMVTWENSRQDGIGSRQAVDALLKSVLAVEPLHPGAHHYTIHLWDGVQPEQALLSAALFARSAPGIAHAWHMPGHTYTGLKRYGDAAYHQEGSARIDHSMMRRERVMPFEIHNYAHNNQWLATSLSHVGRARDAITVSRNLVEQPRDPKKNAASDSGSAQRYGRKRWTEVLIRFELWDDLLQAAGSVALDWSDQPAERIERYYSLGLAHAGLGDRAQLASQVDALKTLVAGEQRKASGQSKGSRRRPSASGATAALAELEGQLKLLDGEHDGAFAEFKKASGMRKEALARAYLAAGRHEDAEKIARENVDRNADQVPPLVTLVEILNGVGKTREAQKVYAKLAPLARNADRDTPPFQRLEAIVASWSADGDWSPPSDSSPESIDSATLNRIDLATVGPLTWSPYPASPFSRTDTRGQSWSLSDHEGRMVLLILYLGGDCAHCMQQLETFGKAHERLKDLGVDVVGVSTDAAGPTRELKNNQEGVLFPMPLLADPSLELFHTYRCFDDFEDQPLHGTFLIDGQGNVRYHNISYEPFLDVEFIEDEARRVARITGLTTTADKSATAAE